MTITNLNSLASGQYAGWQSAKVDDTLTKALDYEIAVKLTMANTAPANDKVAYVYAVPWYYDGSSWFPADIGTTTLPTGTEATVTIASPNDIKLLGVLNYTTQQMVLEGVFSLLNAFGQYLPDGWSLVIINYTGAAIAASDNMVAYKAIKVDIG